MEFRTSVLRSTPVGLSPQRKTEDLVALSFETFEVRLAESAAEVEAAQALRYRVFYEELEARPTPLIKRRARDVDKFD